MASVAELPRYSLFCVQGNWFACVSFRSVLGKSIAIKMCLSNYNTGNLHPSRHRLLVQMGMPQDAREESVVISLTL